MNVLLELENFFNSYKGKKQIIGRSERGKPLYCFDVKKSERPVVIAQYAIHAREYITTYLAIEQIKYFNRYGRRGRVFFIPALNPDGIEICREKPLYKANANGVDLNVNFDARWGTGAKNVTEKGDENFIGGEPFSEAETRAIRDFTLKIMPDATISYHSKGEEIYWRFFQEGDREKRDFSIAKTIAKTTGYTIKDTPDSAGGYKDWCVQRLNIPAFTIEVGSDNLSHPIEKNQLEEIFQRCKGITTTLICALERLCKKNLC